MTGYELIRKLQCMNEEDLSKKVMLWDERKECNVDISEVVFPTKEYDFTEIQMYY